MRMQFRYTIVEIMFQLVLITYLKNPALKARHWMQIESILNTRFTVDTVLTLDLLEGLGVFDHIEEITEISGLASSEESLEALLKKVSLDRDMAVYLSICLSFNPSVFISVYLSTSLSFNIFHSRTFKMCN